MRALCFDRPFLLAFPAMADETTGTILAFDRAAKTLILDDKTIWPFGEIIGASPDLVAGDKVKIDFVGGGDAGIVSITRILRIEG